MGTHHLTFKSLLLFCCVATVLAGCGDSGVHRRDQLPEGDELMSVESTPQFRSSAWRITRTEWTEEDKRGFEDLVTRLGESDCQSFTDCIASSANPYRETDPEGANFRSDCADLPYSLRMYYAWKNGLPFGFIRSVSPVLPPEGEPSPSESTRSSRDPRYSDHGNRITQRFSVITPSVGRYPNAVALMRNLIDYISTATFRVHPEGDGRQAHLFDDFYSPTLDRNGIRPGTTLYDPNGHVAVVYKVGKDGRIFYMDAHPDNSITRGRFGRHFIRSKPEHGAGFRNWRPIRLEGAKQDRLGNWTGGRIVGMSNQELQERGLFSLEQHYGTTPANVPSWSSAEFQWQGKTVDYHDYVRHRLAEGPLKIYPIAEMESLIDVVCQALRDRVDSVNHAVTAGIHLFPHPARFPRNIYGSHGLWEEYSTPSRDARLRVSFLELKDTVESLVSRFERADADLEHTGDDLRKDLAEAYRSSAAACSIRYAKSDGTLQTLDLEQIRKRLFRLSFDPYHCPELRWGAEGAELASCTDSPDKHLWYEASKYLRNQLERRTDVRMDFTPEELLELPPGVGVLEAPDVSVLDSLETLPRANPPTTEHEETGSGETRTAPDQF